MTRVDFWFDPACPWCWITSRWMVEVQGQRHLDVRWRPFSLAEKNGDECVEDHRRVAPASHRALRVIVAAGDQLAGRLYTALGARIHHDGDTALEGLGEAVTSAGVDDPDVLVAADDDGYDDAIRTSMKEALAVAGDDVGVPTIRVGCEGQPAFFGPVISPAPTGQAALDLYDGLVGITAAGDALYELKRDREGAKPQLPGHPLR